MTAQEELLRDLHNLPLDREAVRMMQEDIARITEDEAKKGLPADQRKALKNERLKLEASLSATVSHIGRIERLLALLSPEEQKVLEYMLISPRPQAVFDLAAELCCETSQVYRIRARALRKLIRLRYGAGALPAPPVRKE